MWTVTRLTTFRSSRHGNQGALYPRVINQAQIEKEKNEPLSEERFEEICEAVHNGWWEEKKRQGVTDHPDMIPYSELSEEVKEYDRVTTRRVLDALGLAYRRKPKEAE